MLAATVGVLLSVPFVPPIDSNAMRAYAATIAFTAMLSALGIVHLLSDAPSVGKHPSVRVGRERGVHLCVSLYLWVTYSLYKISQSI